jgi:hypothetical protein
VAPAQDASGGDDTDAPDAPPAGLCPLGYEPINNLGIYRVVNASTATWQAAADDCNNDDDIGGPYANFTHLVVLGGEPERIGLTNGSTPVMGNSWIGLSDRRTEGTFEWVTAEPTSGYPMVGMQPPWDTDDPDDAGGAEDCGRFKLTFVLEDKPCGDSLRYVCECDAFRSN